MGTGAVITSLCHLKSDCGCQTEIWDSECAPLTGTQCYAGTAWALCHSCHHCSTALFWGDRRETGNGSPQLLLVRCWRWRGSLMCNGAVWGVIRDKSRWSFLAQASWGFPTTRSLIKTALLCRNDSTVFVSFVYLLHSDCCASLSAQERAASVSAQPGWPLAGFCWTVLFTISFTKFFTALHIVEKFLHCSLILAIWTEFKENSGLGKQTGVEKISPRNIWYLARLPIAKSETSSFCPENKNK